MSRRQPAREEMIERRCGCICSIDSASAGLIDNRIKDPLLEEISK